MSAILDVQCVLGGNSTYMIKEMSVAAVDCLAVQHWIFKNLPTSTRRDVKSKAVNSWLHRNYHQLSMHCGDVEYAEIERILKSLQFQRVYVKGEQKVQIVKRFIPDADVVNMEDLGCPRLDQLRDKNNSDVEDMSASASPCCIYHMNLNYYHCTLFKVFALRKWLLNNI